MFLKKIIQVKKMEIMQSKKQRPLSALKINLTKSSRSLKQAILSHQGIALIAEFKRTAPSSDGRNSADFYRHTLSQILPLYEQYAHAISILTDTSYFNGTLKDLAYAASVTTRPILRKDFIFDIYQVYESRANGADAILLIARLLTDAQIIEFCAHANQLGMEVVLEIHTATELPRIASLLLLPAVSIAVIGINNRDLETLSVDTMVTKNLCGIIKKKYPALLEHCAVLAESGIATGHDISRLPPEIRAILVGRALMKSTPDTMVSKLQELRKLQYSKQLTKIKVCGITNLFDAKQVAKVGTNYAGLVFVPESRRYITVKKAAGIIAQTGKTFQSLEFAGVFANERIQKISRIITNLQLDCVQLHGAESSGYVRKLKKLHPKLTIIKAFCIPPECSTAEINACSANIKKCPADYVLIDSLNGRASGGSGIPLTDTAIDSLRRKIPDIFSTRLFIAGGITDTNVAAILSRKPFGIDICSGTEEKAGKKSHEKLQRIFRQLAAAKNSLR